MNANTTFDKAAAIARTLSVASAMNAEEPGKVVGDSALADNAFDAGLLANAFPAERKADICRLLAEAMKDKEKGTRNGVSVSTTLSKALEGAKGFSDRELASLRAFWQLAVVADTVVNK
jgi:hypothetical protein